VVGRPCKSKRKDGSPCRGTALAGGDFCVFHSPKHAARRAEGRRRGGRSRCKPAATLPPDSPDLPLRTAADIVALLELTINQVRKGTVDTRIANCVGLLAGQLLRAIEGGELEKRMAELEARLDNAPVRPRLNGRVAS
jgi:hypothetical protein